MRSGDRPGLQNRRVAGFPVAGGFDSHSLPPFVFNEKQDREYPCDQSVSTIAMFRCFDGCSLEDAHRTASIA
jgi:hypothetical protein